MKRLGSISILYGATVFLSAYLLFALEPAIAKYLLPWFGGSPSVWTTSLLFFMVMLLLGYLYADMLIRRAGRKLAPLIHFAFIAFVVGLETALAISWPSVLTPGPAWKPSPAADPALSVLMLLFVSVGAPYFLLSSTSSLMQAWYSKIASGNPYAFYALSNAGSALSLLSYPILFEPNFDLKTQGRLWLGGFYILSILLVIIAVHFRKNAKEERGPAAAAAAGPSHSLWEIGFLAALASFLLVTVTTKITQGIASVPFLWIAPLALYLFSYVLAFSGKKLLPLSFYAVPLVLLSFACLGFWKPEASIGLKTPIALFLGFLFIACFFLNRRSYLLRPDRSRLTGFYLAMSAGSALGGFAASILAPLLLSGYFELPFALVLCVYLGARELSPTLAARVGALFSRTLAAALVFFAFLMATLIATGDNAGLISRVRNFYGVASVRDSILPNSTTTIRYIENGAIVHGNELMTAGARLQPTAYYSETSGLGLAMRQLRAAGKPIAADLVGLGAGTIAAYCERGDAFSYYEINAAVLDAAERDFSYLSRCRAAAEVRVILGDGRLSIENDNARALPRVDLIVLDAFSDDAIPVHLLTKEAFDHYLLRLKPGGLIAVHISNQYINLAPVLKSIAAAENLSGVLILDAPTGNAAVYPSVWVLLSSAAARFKTPDIESRAYPLSDQKNIRLWTDVYSTLFPLIQ